MELPRSNTKRHCTETPKIKFPMSEKHLKHLRGLTQFERCWSIIDSHLKLYSIFNRLKNKIKGV